MFYFLVLPGVLKLQEPLFHINVFWLKAGVTGQSLIIILGGIFLLYKSVTKIHHKFESEEEGTKGKASATLTNAIS